MAAVEVQAVESVRTIDVRYDVHIDAPIEKVFDALTDGAGEWWSHLFRTEAKDVVLEPRVGGRFFEDWGNGEGALYATVTRVRRPELVALVGGFGMSHATNFVTYQLERDGNGTKVRLTHWGFGDMEDGTAEAYGGGWKVLFDQALREYVERGVGKGPRSRR